MHEIRKKLDEHNLPHFLSDSDVCGRCDSTQILVFDLTGPNYSGLAIRGQYRFCLDCGDSELSQEMLQKALREARAKEAQSNHTHPTNTDLNSHQ